MFKNLNVEALGVSGTQSEIIELALSFGFRGIDLDLLDFAEQAKAQGVAKARRLIDSAKLKLGGFRLPVDLDVPDDVFAERTAALAPLLEIAAEVGCKRCWTHIEPATDEAPYPMNFERHRQRLGDLGKQLEPFEIRLAVGYRSAVSAREGKQFQFIQDPDALLMLLGMVPSRSVGFLVDTWDLHVSGSSLAGLQSKLKPEQVVSVRLADFPADLAPEAATEEDRLLPGETGQIDAAAALVWLAEGGYDGPITPYPAPQRVGGVRRDEIVKRAGGAIDAVWKAAGLTPAGKLPAAQSR